LQALAGNHSHSETGEARVREPLTPTEVKSEERGLLVEVPLEGQLQREALDLLARRGEGVAGLGAMVVRWDGKNVEKAGQRTTAWTMECADAEQFSLAGPGGNA
jgi:hypothetical protein